MLPHRLTLGLHEQVVLTILRTCTPLCKVSFSNLVYHAWLDGLHVFNHCHVLLSSHLLKHLEVRMILMKIRLLGIQDHIDLVHFVILHHVCYQFLIRRHQYIIGWVDVGELCSRIIVSKLAHISLIFLTSTFSFVHFKK